MSLEKQLNRTRVDWFRICYSNYCFFVLNSNFWRRKI